MPSRGSDVRLQDLPVVHARMQRARTLECGPSMTKAFVSSSVDGVQLRLFDSSSCPAPQAWSKKSATQS
jgi:hypothetical protein